MPGRRFLSAIASGYLPAGESPLWSWLTPCWTCPLLHVRRSGSGQAKNAPHPSFSTSHATFSFQLRDVAAAFFLPFSCELSVLELLRNVRILGAPQPPLRTHACIDMS